MPQKQKSKLSIAEKVDLLLGTVNSLSQRVIDMSFALYKTQETLSACDIDIDEATLKAIDERALNRLKEAFPNLYPNIDLEK